MIIGLTGKNGSGKGEVARFLKERGFEYHSLSDVIREELERKSKRITRDQLVETGNRLRRRFGPDVLAKRIVERLESDKNYVIDSIRHPSEVKVFQPRNNFVLLNVTAPPRVRFERLKKRGRENDPKTFSEFKNLELRESKSAVRSDQQLDQAIKMADYEIKNTGSLKTLQEQITDIVMKIAGKKKRPDWDEYFLGIAKVVALRSNCVKRKVAAVIVKDKRIISTGYNGTPRGVKNCNEGGCPRCNQLTAPGAKLDECLCSHGEENAITQSAYHGVNIKDSTLYSTYSPCLLCTKMIINSGIREVVFNVDYPMSGVSTALLKEAGITVRKVKID